MPATSDRDRADPEPSGADTLGRHDGWVVRHMIALPWSAHESWREAMTAAVTAP